MRQSKLIKGLTLLSFVFFITTFILYRVGKLDPHLAKEKSALQTSHNGGTIKASQSDTLKPKNDSTQKLMPPSSKVLIANPDKHSFLDSIKKRPNFLKPKNREMMGSSKSAVMFKPTQKIRLTVDSLKYDSAQRKMQIKQ